MNFMKYETIKAKAIDELRGAVSIGSQWPSDALFLALQGAVEQRRNPRELAAEWTEEAVKIIKQWDVRCVGKLVELFPACIPKRFHGLAMRAEMADNEDADCIVYFGGGKEL